MQRTINCTTSVVLEYDENSDKFKEAYDSYTSVIYSEGSINDMLNYVCDSVIRNGTGRMIEGVGYVTSESGFITDPDIDSGIKIADIY